MSMHPGRAGHLVRSLIVTGERDEKKRAQERSRFGRCATAPPNAETKGSEEDLNRR